MTQPSPATIQSTSDIVDGNLRVTKNGYWAEYRITNPMLYGGRSHNEKHDVRTAHEQLFNALIPHKPVFGGWLRPETDKEITEKSLADIDGGLLDPDQVPRYAEMVTARVQALANDPARWPKTRVFPVAFPVGKTLREARRNRKRILAALPTTWKLTPADPADMEWLWRASIHRGVLLMPTRPATGRVTDLTPAFFDDGAKEDDIEDFGQFKRPAILKISPDGPQLTAAEKTPSYQAILKINFPTGHMPFPGGTELFEVLNRTGIHADWAIRCQHVPHDQVVADNDAARKTIESNKYETALEADRINTDVVAEALLDDYDAKLAVNKGDSIRFTAIVAIGGQSLTDVDNIATFLGEVFYHLQIDFERIAGVQQDMWSAMLPGNTAHDTVNALADEVDIAGFSEMVPFTTAALGTTTGPIYGRNLKSGLNDLFRIDTRALLAGNQAANLVAGGGLGAGKTTILMTGALHDAAMGNPFFAQDRTDLGEFVRVAELVDGHIIVDLLNPDRSVCPLKTFQHNPRLAGRHALSTYLNLLKLEIGTDDALALSEALTKDSITGANPVATPITSTKRLEHVLLNTDDPAAHRVGRLLRMWANYDFARALFDEDLDPIDYTAPAIVLRTYGLPAATAAELNNEHLYKRLSPEKLYVEAIYELTGHAVREHFFNSPRICSIYLPEAWHIAPKPVGREMIEICAHDSRKHGVALWMDSHLGKQDFPDGLTDLIGIRFVGRTEEEAATENLQWGGMHPEHNPEFFKDITSGFKPGQFLVRFFDQIGAVQFFLPTDAAARAAMNTTFRAAS